MPNQFPPHLSSRWSLAPWLLAALAAGLSACAPMPMPVTETETETPAAHVTTHAAMLDTVPPIPPAPVRADGRLQIPQSLVALTQPAGQKRLMTWRVTSTRRCGCRLRNCTKPHSPSTTIAVLHAA
jgi:hypothetical protein